MTATPVRIKPPSPEEIARGPAPAGVVKLADLLAEEADEHEDYHHAQDHDAATDAGVVKEIGGRRDGPDPTRYGDWEKNGRCIDF